jgi:hypothetical protein
VTAPASRALAAAGILPLDASRIAPLNSTPKEPAAR